VNDFFPGAGAMLRDYNLFPLVLLAVLLSCAAAEASNDADVIIVGAGMAGVTAAKALVSDYNLSAIVLEARDRPGGRTYSLNTTQGAWI